MTAAPHWNDRHAPGFWAGLEGRRAEPEVPHARCRKKSIQELLRPKTHGGCESCAHRKLKWSLMQGGPIRDNAERLMRIHHIEPETLK